MIISKEQNSFCFQLKKSKPTIIDVCVLGAKNPTSVVEAIPSFCF